jgi:sterol desaturase/sphingolipid hydroxylase (fatty acid hydroxylase superfamily)
MNGETTIRLSVFAFVLLAMAAWEWIAPRRAQTIGRGKRWPSHLAIVLLDALLVRIAFPTAAVGFAIISEQRGWGLFNVLGVSRGLAVVLSVIALDFAIYLQHVLFHAVPAFWRLHRMHHADLEI